MCALAAGSKEMDGDRSYILLNLSTYFIFAIGPIVGNAVLAQLSPIAIDFAVDPTSVLSAIPAFMIPFAIIQLFSGAISDVRGRIPVILAGLSTYLVGNTIIVFSATLIQFIFGNFLGGVGFGFVNPVLIAVLTDTAKRSEVSKRMGLLGAVATGSVGLGPGIAGQLALIGWRTFYVLFVFLTLFGMAAMCMANKPQGDISVRTSVRELAAIFAEELRKPIVILLMLSSFLISETYGALFIWTSRSLADFVEPSVSGIILLSLGVSGVIAGLSLGQLVERFSQKTVLYSGLLALVLSNLVLIFSVDSSGSANPTMIGAGILILGWAGGTLSPNINTYSQTISPGHRGALAGMVTFALFTGRALVPALFGGFFETGIRQVYLAILVATGILIVLVLLLVRSVKK
ncbi:MFS transporter [Candidatus Thorarchaeota archaeon]|nr:MAG: MFS transporter [Candidatus Thorarchaeota archaeon]